MDVVLTRYAFAFPEAECDVLIEGEAPGADTMARQWAERYGIPVEKYPSDWEGLGRSAGPRRNIQMLKEGKPDLVVAFFNKVQSQSRGTSHMVSIARQAGVETLCIEHVPGQS